MSSSRADVFGISTRLGASVGSCLILLTGPHFARADTGRLVLVDPDPTFERAVAVALEPWALEVRSVVESAPGATLPRSAAIARVIARRTGARGVVWISETSDGLALWLYDASDDRVVARPISVEPPFDEPDAAALALSLKTLLRHSHLAPETERFGGSESREPDEPARSFWVGVSLGARVLELSPASAEPRLGLSIAYLGLVLGAAMGAFVELDVGLGLDVDRRELTARFTSSAVSAGVLARWPLGAFDLGLAAALGARLTTLDGAILAPTQPVSVARVNPTAGVALTAGFTLDRVRFGVRGGAELPLRAQTYLVDGAQVLELSVAVLAAAATFEVALF